MANPVVTAAGQDGFCLRPYQLDAVDEVHGQYQAGKAAVLLVAPTGSGKTAVGCHFVKQAVDLGKRCLWLAHRSELIRQASQRLANDYKVRHGIIKAGSGECDPRFPVQVASVQTLARRRPFDRVGLLVVDEAHHATADTYVKIIDAHPDATILGLTATPWRLTGRRLGSLFDGIVAIANYPFLIRQGFLVRPRVFLPAEVPDFGAIRMLGGEYDEDQAAAIMGRPKLVGDVVDQWRKQAANSAKPRSTIVFACNIAHSLHLVEAFRAAGVAAEHLDAQVPEKHREAILARLENGQTTVVCNVVILSEGFDCPPVSCVVVARPTASRTLFIQMVGRALRPCPAIGKADCIILDHAGNSFRHGLISEITSYELDDGDLLDTASALSACKQCPSCRAVLPRRTQVCPECGHSFALDRQFPDVVDGELVEFGEAPAADSQSPSAADSQSPSAADSQSPSTVDSHLAATATPPPAPVADLPGETGHEYARVLDRLGSPDVPSLLAALRGSLNQLPPTTKHEYVKAGLLGRRPDLWLEQMAQAKCLAALGLGCVERLRGVRIQGYSGPPHFERAKRAVRNAKPDLVIRLAATMFAAGVPDFTEQAAKRGFKAVRAYAARSAALAEAAFRAIGLSGEPRECALELIRHHEYIFDQVLQRGTSEPLPKLAERFRKKLGPLWKQHFELAECLWDGPVLRWIRTNYPTICGAVDDAEEKLCAIKPEEACPLDGHALLARYGIPTGGWIRILKDEIGKWCLSHSDKAQDTSAVQAAADVIFAANRATNPLFNADLPYLRLDTDALSEVADPLGVHALLLEAARLRTSDVAGWARGYRRRAVAAVIGAVADTTNHKPTASQCARLIVAITDELPDITLGELYKGLTSPRRTPAEVAATVRRGRETVTGLRERYARTKTAEFAVQLARALRDVGHLEEAAAVAREALQQSGPDPSIERLVDNIKKQLSDRAPATF